MPRPYTINDVVSDLRVPLQSFTYEFTASAGQDLIFGVLDNQNDNNFFNLTAPSGAVLLQDIVEGSRIPTLAETGTYTLTATSVNPADVDLVGAFGFRVFEDFSSLELMGDHQIEIPVVVEVRQGHPT